MQFLKEVLEKFQLDLVLDKQIYSLKRVRIHLNAWNLAKIDFELEIWSFFSH